MLIASEKPPTRRCVSELTLTGPFSLRVVCDRLLTVPKFELLLLRRPFVEPEYLLAGEPGVTALP